MSIVIYQSRKAFTCLLRYLEKSGSPAWALRLCCRVGRTSKKTESTVPLFDLRMPAENHRVHRVYGSMRKSCHLGIDLTVLSPLNGRIDGTVFCLIVHRP
jgi:hypothetical protein